MAVSYKYGGRCIGGVELTKNQNDNSYSIVKENGAPKWVRPVTRNTEHGEIPMYLSSTCKVMDIVKLTDVEACPDCAQSENYYFRGIKKVGHLATNSETLNMLCDNMHNLLFGNRGKAVHPDSYETMDYSLMLIKAQDVNFFMETRYGTDRMRLRVNFSYNGITYDLPVTDPDLCEQADYGVEALNGRDAYYMTISLGVEYEGWHSKLVANVIPLD
jgi:hypothetical protein